MLHLIDHSQGGDLYLFDNGALVSWGVNQDRQTAIMKLALQKKDTNYDSTKEEIEYTIDEDE